MVENKSSVYDRPEPEYTPLVAVVDQGTDGDENRVAEPSPLGARVDDNHNSNLDTSVPDTIEPIPNLADDNKVEQLEQEQFVASGVGAGVVGLLLGGPVLGIVLGFGAAYAHDKPGAAGDTARAVGDITLSVRDRAQEIDQRHGVVEKSKRAAQEAWERAKELDQRHHVMERTKERAVQGFHAAADFVNRHNLIERGIESIGKAVYWLAEKVAKAFNCGDANERGQHDRSATTTSNASTAPTCK